MYPNQGQPVPIQGQAPIMNNTQAQFIQPTAPAVIVPPIQRQLTFVVDPLAEIANCTGALIEQKIDFFENVICGDIPNRFNVYCQSPYGMNYFFKCTEESSCCARCCCPAADRAYTMDIKHITNENELTADLADSYITLIKPCSCCCFCRPTISVIRNKDNYYFGKIREPLCSCSPRVDIYDKNNNFKYEISTTCCQEAFCCGGLCAKINDVKFKIYSADSENVVGEVIKKACGGFGELVTKADTFLVKFPKMATPEDKILLIVSALLIDYEYFELSNKDRNKRH